MPKLTSCCLIKRAIYFGRLRRTDCKGDANTTARAMQPFLEKKLTLDNYWRSIILFGRNVASYKFALAQTLLELAAQEKTAVTYDELAAPFAKNISEHLKVSDKQGTSSSSKFLDAARKFNLGEL